MTGAKKIFTEIILVGIILTNIAYFIPMSSSSCAKPGVFNPLGRFAGDCLIGAQKFQPGTLFYIMLDLMFIMIVIYLIYLAINKARQAKAIV
jgi:hypothetical protein